MRASMIGFKAISGAYDGENLSRYTVGLLEHVGILDKKRLKVFFSCDSLTMAVSDCVSAICRDFR